MCNQVKKFRQTWQTRLVLNTQTVALSNINNSLYIYQILYRNNIEPYLCNPVGNGL